MSDKVNFQQKINYTFKNEKLLTEALTHSSYANESGSPLSSNERLEFLGDSVLSIITSRYLFAVHKLLPEGELTKIRASLVCEKALYDFAKQIELGNMLVLGKGENQTGGRARPSVLADAFEALIAAIYLDGGMESAEKFVLSFVKEAEKEQKQLNTDYKTILQEVVQKNPEEHLEYVLVAESGPAHDKRFETQLCLNSNIIGSGVGKSKKESEQRAAFEALRLMGLCL
jgi:ribonuclease-3